MNKRPFNKQEGLTLIEVLIAVTILALIGTISYQSLDATIKSKEVVEEHLEELARIDRAWLLLEADLRNLVNFQVTQAYGPGSGSQLPSLVLTNTEGDYWMTMLRGGHANPLGFVRTELIRVGYRVEEETLWRDVWYDLSSVDVEQARQQKIIEGVEQVEVRVLSPVATSFSAGPWLDVWPNPGGNPADSPMAVEIKLTLKDEEHDISRLFALVKGR